jgi:hypothetical protein
MEMSFNQVKQWVMRQLHSAWQTLLCHAEGVVAGPTAFLQFKGQQLKFF